MIKKRYLFIGGVIIVFTLISLCFGFYLGKIEGEKLVIQGVINRDLGRPDTVDFSLFWDAWIKLQEKYVDNEELDYQKMVYGAISGMVESLDDPYTVFLPPEDSKIFLEDISGSFEGVGMEIGIRNNQLTIIAPLENTPAQRAGLRPGDKILEVDGISTADIGIEQVVKLIRGPKGTEVVLTIFRKGWAQPEEIKVIRNVIKVPSLKLEILDDNIAYVKIYHFSQKADSDFDKMALEILNSSSEKIILDLRNNPGGYLEVSVDIAGWFLERGDVVVIEDFGGKQPNMEYKARGNAKFSEYPMVILINQGSASASEILAGALQDNLGVKLIGAKSFGKGSVQELEKLPGATSLKITIAKWLTPNGQLITDVGLAPDIEVEMTEEDYEKDRDPQLDKAVEIIKEMRYNK
ncbi:S41 family peptidase [Candidatus Parcubacteria bacterium]|nr:S41 family peptidase [Candidatus Parcubacteria bacterium]